MTELELEIAVHEAGHAVIARVLGLEGGAATLVADESGRAQAAWTADNSIKDIMASLGGRAATEVLLDRASDEGCSFDDERAMGLLESNGFRGCFDARRCLLGDTRRLAERHKAAIALVAIALLDRETLTGGEIDELLED
jgi:hypothetical protein